jgi:hypothetical protein
MRPMCGLSPPKELKKPHYTYAIMGSNPAKLEKVNSRKEIGNIDITLD